MSMRRSSSARRGSEGPAATGNPGGLGSPGWRVPPADEVELGPDEVLDDQDDDAWDVAPDKTPPVPVASSTTGTTGNGERRGRAGGANEPAGQNGQSRPVASSGQAATAAPVRSTADDDTATDDEWVAGQRVRGRAAVAPEVPAPFVAEPVTATAPAAEGTFVEWLSRPWLSGLTHWQAGMVVLLAIALVITRFYNLGDRAMHHDESMHAKFAWDTLHGQVYKYNPLLHGPFQFLVVGANFFLLGATEWTARAVPATFGVALVALTILWRRWLGSAGWLFALAIFVFSPSFTYFARMLREDSYTATWTFLAATGLIGYVLHRKRAWYYAFCAGLSLAFATKESTYITAFIFGTFMMLSLAWEYSNRMGRRVIAGAVTGAIIGAFLTMVVGYKKQELREVGGAIIGLVAGGGLGLLYHFARAAMRPVPDSAVGQVMVGQPAAPSRPRVRRPRDVMSTPRRRRTFADAFVALWRDASGFWGLGTFWGGVIIFFAIYVLFYSSFFTNMPGIRAGMVDSIKYWLDQHGVQRGNQPWFYYIMLLSAYETLPWLFGLVATAYYLRRPTWLTSFLIWWWVVSLVIYSWAGEKMPWLILHIATPLVLLTARYLGELAASAARSIWEKRIAFSTLAVLAIWTLHTGWPVNFERPDTPKDMLVYTQTAPDVKKVMADIERMSLEQTGDAFALGVTVQSGTWWPFSWYLRDFKNADYPSQLTTPATKPVVLIAAEDDEKNRQYLQGYTRTKYKMRWWYPEDYRTIPEQIAKSGNVFQFVARKDVRDSLWKWMIYRETTQPLGSYDFYLYIKQGLAGASGVNASVGEAAAAVGQTAPGQPAPGQPAPQVQRALQEQYTAKQVTLNPVVQWGAAGKGQAQFTLPRGMALDTQGNVYVADSGNHRIQKFDRTGKVLLAWGVEGAGDGQFKEPMGVAVDPQGNVYVADTWNHRIQKFDATGKFLTKWLGQGGFWGPRAIALDGQGNVYVADTGNKRIQKFDNTGKYLTTFASGGKGPGQLDEPIGLAVTPAGEMYVADTNNRRIQKLDATGKPVAEWVILGWQPGPRTEPYLALDSQGNLYATDPPSQRYMKFSPTGDLLAVGGGAGRNQGQFDQPLGIVVGDGVVYVADSGNGRIQGLAPFQ